jgi:hypothetical protein
VWLERLRASLREAGMLDICDPIPGDAAPVKGGISPITLEALWGCYFVALGFL